MKKFYLWFPKPTEAMMVMGRSAYICIRNPFDDGSGQHTLVKSKGRILILNEAVSGEECSAQIDVLIEELKGLKASALRGFKKH